MTSIDITPFWLSLATTVTATALTFVAGVWCAWHMLSVRSAWRVWVDGVLTLPLILPPTVVGYFLLLFFGRHSPIGKLLECIGITIVFSWPATVIAAAVVAFPLMYRTTLGAFEQVNPALLDAARTLGANERRVFIAVLAPLAKPGVVAGTVLAFARAMGEFGATLMLAGNIPGHTQTMPIAIFSSMEGGDQAQATLWVVVIVALSLAMIRLLHFPASDHSRCNVTSPTLAAPVAIHPTFQTIYTAGQHAPSLTATLAKQLHGFKLSIVLDAGKSPVGLLGASGAGKSITFRMLAGLVHPDIGKITLNGRTLYSYSEGINLPPAERRIGVVFQDYALFPHRTVAENVGFALDHCSVKQRKARVASLLRGMNIDHLAHQYPAQISGGERQRAAIARCLAMDPEALLFDEPFAALDPHLRRSMEEQLRQTLKHFPGAVLFITHDMEEAFRFCTHLAVLERGQLLANGPRQAIFDHPQHRAVAQLTGCKNIALAKVLEGGRVLVGAWGCTLNVSGASKQQVNAVGYRSHHFRMQNEAVGENVFSCWLLETSEAPHEMTLYLSLHGDEPDVDCKPLQVDMPKPEWRQLCTQPQPWRIQFVPERILLLVDDSHSSSMQA